MIPLSSKQTVTETVDDITYTLAVPTLLSRASYRRDVAAMGAVYHSDETMLNVLREGVRECVAEDQQGQLIETINSFELEQKAMQELGDEATDDERESLDDLRDQIDQVEKFMQREFDEYNAMTSDRGYWLSVAPIIAFRHFVKGWEGSPVSYKESGGLVRESLMDELPPEHIDTIGWKAIMLMTPTDEQSKNSEPQLQLATDPTTSTADDSHQTMDQVGT